MRKIWKFDIFDQGNPVTRLEMPVGARIVHVGVQDQTESQQIRVALWADFCHDGPTLPRTFEWFGTGHEIPDYAQYIGTVKLYNDLLVLHLCEIHNQ